MKACPHCGQGRLRRSIPDLLLMLARQAISLGLIGFGVWALWAVAGYLDATPQGSLLWLLKLAGAVFFAGFAVLPIALGLALFGIHRRYRCDHCARQYRRRWFGALEPGP